MVPCQRDPLGEFGGKVGYALRFLKGGGCVSVDTWKEEICGSRNRTGKDVEEQD